MTSTTGFLISCEILFATPSHLTVQKILPIQGKKLSLQGALCQLQDMGRISHFVFQPRFIRNELPWNSWNFSRSAVFTGQSGFHLHQMNVLPCEERFKVCKCTLTNSVKRIIWLQWYGTKAFKSTTYRCSVKVLNRTEIVISTENCIRKNLGA